MALPFVSVLKTNSCQIGLLLLLIVNAQLFREMEFVCNFYKHDWALKSLYEFVMGNIFDHFYVFFLSFLQFGLVLDAKKI